MLSKTRGGNGTGGAAASSLTDLAQGTGAPPGSTKGGTALGLQGGSIDVDLTTPVDDSLPASALDGFCGGPGGKSLIDTETQQP